MALVLVTLMSLGGAGTGDTVGIGVLGLATLVALGGAGTSDTNYIRGCRD